MSAPIQATMIGALMTHNKEEREHERFTIGAISGVVNNLTDMAKASRGQRSSMMMEHMLPRAVDDSVPERRRERGHDDGGEMILLGSQQQAKNSIIGLEFIDGRVLYFHRSTLVNAGGYFAAYFGDNGLVAVPSHTDEHGREIYFIEREGELFRRYIMPFIIKKHPGELGSFNENPDRWRSLREEAEFYALDDLIEMLSCEK